MQNLTFVKPINSWCFNLPMASCKDHCDYGLSRVGYCMNSIDFRMNESKRKKNKNFIDNDPNFEAKLLHQIDLTRHTHFRINSIGDFDFNDNGVLQLQKIMNLIKKRPNLNFWITTHSEYLINKAFKTRKFTLKNASLQLSHQNINEKWPNFLIEYYNKKGISVTSSTINPKLSNCPKSITWTHKNSSCGSCDKCYNPGGIIHNTIFNLHGTHAKTRLKKYQEKQ